MSDKTEKKQTKKKSKKGFILKTLLILFLLVIVAGFGVAAKIVTDINKSTSDFNINSLISKSSSVMCYYDDTTGEWVDFEFVGTESTGTRDNVYYEDLPQVLVDAVVATEDARFFTHNGIDIPRIAKAFYSLATSGEISSGGSTITQQLIKNAYYLNKEDKVNKWERKVGEILLALKVEQKVSKEDIIVDYLNMIQFGNSLSTLGISAASHYYFDKDVQELTLPEAALLAGVLNQPSRYDPYYNLQEATERRNTVLDLMERHGYITSEEAAAAKAIPVENYLKKQSSSSTDTYTAYQSYYDNVLAELNEIGVDPYEESIRIYTNMDVDLQEYAESIGAGELFTWDTDVLETSMTLVETHTGKVLCTLGGREYVGVQNPYDTSAARTNRTRERHQPGSSLKPIITYAAAFEFLDWSTGQYISNETYDYYGIQIHNWDGEEGGDISLTEALKLSYNNPAMYTTEYVRDEIGTDGYINYLESFGFDLSDESFDLQYAIGGWEHGVTTLQTAGAYAALSNEGTYIEPHFIYKIEYLDSNKEDLMVTEEAIAAAEEIISPESSFMIREVLRSYSKERYAGMNIPYNVCAKSGTTNYDDALCEQYGLEQYSAKDSLLNAFTEDYAVSVWVGYDTPGYYKAITETEKTYAGISAGALLTKAHNGTTVNSWSQPEGVVQATMVTGTSDPYVKPDSSIPSSLITTAWFKKTNVPQDAKLDLTIGSLDSFTADYDEEAGTINVKFGTYSGGSGEKNAAKVLGDAIYVVEIQDSDGSTIGTYKSEDENEFTIDYAPTSNITVIGYYARSKVLSVTSNKISVSIEVQGSDSYVNCSTYTMNAISHSYSSSDIISALGMTLYYRGEAVSPSDITITGSIDPTTEGTYTIRAIYKNFTSDPITVTVVGNGGHSEGEESGEGDDHSGQPFAPPSFNN